jgi:hypothetical protein
MVGDGCGGDGLLDQGGLVGVVVVVVCEEKGGVGCDDVEAEDFGRPRVPSPTGGVLNYGRGTTRLAPSSTTAMAHLRPATHTAVIPGPVAATTVHALLLLPLAAVSSPPLLL